MAKTRKQDEDDKADKAAAGNSGQLAQKAERPDPVYNGVSYNMPTNVKDLQKHLRQFVQRLETARVKKQNFSTTECRVPGTNQGYAQSGHENKEEYGGSRQNQEDLQVPPIP